MEQEQFIVALEFGSSKILGAVATKNASGLVSLVAMEEKKVVDCVRYGCIQNIEETASRLRDIINSLEKRTSLKHNKITGVYVGVQGRYLKNFTTEIRREFADETPVTDAILNELKKEAIRKSPVASEGYDVFDILIKKFLVDNQESRSPIGTLGNSIDVTFNLLKAKPTLKNNLKRVIEGRMQLEIKGYLPTPICAADDVLTIDERQLGCMLVDFGAETTAVSIYKHNVLQYFFTMPIGSRNITRDITSLNILEDKAENHKQLIGNANPKANLNSVNLDGIASTDINNFISARAGEIITNIVAQIEYAGFTSSDIPSGIILIGGGTKLNEFDTQLEQQLKIKIRKGSLSQNINILEPKVNGFQYAQIVSLINKGAAIIKPNDSCCEPMPVEEPMSNIQNPMPERKAEKVKKEPGAIKSILTKLKESTSALFGDDENDDDDV